MQGTLSSPISQGRWEWRGGLQCDWRDSHWRQWSESPQGRGGPGGHCRPQPGESVSLYTQAWTPLSVVVLETPGKIWALIPLVQEGCV